MCVAMIQPFNVPVAEANRDQLDILSGEDGMTGGKREGAGRPKGSKNIATLEQKRDAEEMARD